MKSAKAAIEVTKNVIPFLVARACREQEELAFLPAALEIVGDATVANWSRHRRDHHRALLCCADLGNLRTCRYCCVCARESRP